MQIQKIASEILVEALLDDVCDKLIRNAQNDSVYKLLENQTTHKGVILAEKQHEFRNLPFKKLWEGATKTTKPKFITEFSGENFPKDTQHLKLLVTFKNFLSKHLPNTFRATFFDEDVNPNQPNFEQFVDAYQLRKIFDEESGDSPKPATIVVDEQKEDVATGTQGGEWMKFRAAIGFFENTKIVLIEGRRSGISGGDSPKPYNSTFGAICMAK